MTDRHLIIAGQPRSGSTLFFNMLHHCLQDFTLQATEASALSLLDHPGNTCTKRPLDIFDVHGIVARNRGAKRLELIVTLRDPRDILISYHRSVPGAYFCDADASHFVPKDGPPRLGSPGLLATHRAIAELLNSGTFPGGVFLLKYEHLVADPDRIQAKLAEGFGLRFEGRFGDFHKGAIPEALKGPLNGIRAVDPSRVAAWRAPEHRARIIDQFTRFPALHDVVVALGYEENRDWFAEFLAKAA